MKTFYSTKNCDESTWSAPNKQSSCKLVDGVQQKNVHENDIFMGLKTSQNQSFSTLF